MQALRAHGVELVFGIPGTHTLPIHRHLAAGGIRHVTPRHEQGGGYAADGYARVSGRPGVVLATSGPGVINAATAAATAYADSVPMLIVSPAMPTDVEGRDTGYLHEGKDQGAAMDALVALEPASRVARRGGRGDRRGVRALRLRPAAAGPRRGAGRRAGAAAAPVTLGERRRARRRHARRRPRRGAAGGRRAAGARARRRRARRRRRGAPRSASPSSPPSTARASSTSATRSRSAPRSACAPRSAGSPSATS